MNTMPGFSADSSLRHNRSYRSHGRCGAAQTQQVVPQLRIGGGGIGGAGLGLHWPSWCEIGCASAAALCIAATDGIGIAACIASEITCLAGCKGGLTSSGYGGYPA